MSDKELIRKARRSFALTLLDEILDPLKDAAKEHGYSLAIHGSLSKDIDLICVPWVQDVSDHEKLARAIADVLWRYFNSVTFLGDVGNKPHGRKAYTIVVSQTVVYFDVSIYDPRENIHPDTHRAIMEYSEIKEQQE